MVVRRLQAAKALEGKPQNQKNAARLLADKLSASPNLRIVLADLCGRHFTKEPDTQRRKAASSLSLALPHPVLRQRNNESPTSFMAFFQRPGRAFTLSRWATPGSSIQPLDGNGLWRASEAEMWDLEPYVERNQMSELTSEGELDQGNCAPLLQRPKRVWYGPWESPLHV